MKDTQIKIDHLLHRLVHEKISDLHFDLSQDSNKMIFRRHKVQIKMEKGKEIHLIYDYFKYISQVDLSMASKPQTGTFEYFIHEKSYHFRFAMIETHFRKSGVLRVLNLTSINSLKEIIPKNHPVFDLLNIKNGIVLFTGATGSGKSTTQFHFLKEFKDKQIYILEDPIEVYDEAFIQIDIKAHNLDFDSAMTQLLRHDPDVIALGEVRKNKELSTLIRAGLSGHIVSSTLHAGNLDHVLSRLMDLGASKYDLSHVLKGIVFQELKQDKKGEVYAEISLKTEKEIKEKIFGK